ncbi:MAG: COP23 domain-containing protein [Microcoleaceae cyanobacterium]
MKFQSFHKWATIACFSLAVVTGLTQHGQAQQSRGRASFFCGTDGGKPATIARLPQKNGKTTLRTLIIWEIGAFKGYPPEKRCPLVSQKFQDNQNTGDLKYIVSGKANTWPVLCASKQNYNYIVDCPDSNVLMTLLPGDDSQAMIKKFEKLNKGRSTTALRHRSDEVLVSNGNLQAINVDKWMDNSQETIEEDNQCIWGCE